MRFRAANPWDDDLSPEVSAQERPLGRGLRPLSAPAGGAVAVCPHCWGLNVGGERLCGRCGADMTLVLQESGGLRRTAAVQSPVPVQVAGRLGIAARAVLLLMTALLALAWLVVPLLGSAGGGARNHRQSGRVGERASGSNISPTPPLPHSPTHPARDKRPSGPRQG